MLKVRKAHIPVFHKLGVDLEHIPGDNLHFMAYYNGEGHTPNSQNIRSVPLILLILPHASFLFTAIHTDQLGAAHTPHHTQSHL